MHMKLNFLNEFRKFQKLNNSYRQISIELVLDFILLNKFCLFKSSSLKKTSLKYFSKFYCEIIFKVFTFKLLII